MFRSILSTIALAIFFLGGAAVVRAESWVVYYSDQEPDTRFESYSLIVFDSLYHPPLERLKERGKMILGYLSLGEVEDHRDHFQTVKEMDLLLMENEDWPGSFFVDVRKPAWTAMVIESLIPQLLQKGFHGLFLDTMDNPGHLEDLDAKRYRGMRQGGIDLIKAIRRNFPDIPIMINRSFDLLDRVLYDVDMVLAESIRSLPDPSTKSHRLTDNAEYEATATRLRRLKEIRPRLELYSLDYWDPDDPKGQAAIYRQQREHGFNPYVSTIELNRVIPEPAP
ncbi:MAG: endo alpha-1,4 polygalactosaminidase [Magnetococcales bacterium]|nr:endo alpha-1,4 polygalactosaminidase [Magnetococcales bacterium]